MPRYYEDVEPGDELGSCEKIATRHAVAEFCEVWGTPAAARFTDDGAAQKEGLPSAIVPGIMSMAYMAQLLSRWADGGLLKSLDVVFRQTVLHEQSLQLVGVVTDKAQDSHGSHVTCDVYILSADGERLVGGKAIVLLPNRP